MPPASDFAIRELGREKLALRADILFMPHRARGEAYYVVEDPANSKFHRIGAAEYAFITLLDGHTTVRDALQKVAQASPDYAFNEYEAATICRWLIEAELAHTSESSQADRLVHKARRAEQRQRWQRWNPIVFRLPLFRPSRLFAALTGRLGCLHSRTAFAVWLLVTVAGAYHVFADWERFLASSKGILAPGNWLWLLLSWIVLKIVHEISHGIACCRYGGTVREAGVLLLLFAPIAYVDVTSSWRFRSKWQRVHTAAAGMYIESFIAALAALVWSATSPGPLNNVCHNVVVMASFTTFVINANPLMRFDGYYILSDLFEIPNLYGDGQRYLVYFLQRYLLGISLPRPTWARSQRFVVPLYGLAALCWRITISACLLIAATTLFRGAGVVLAALGAILWFGPPAVSAVRYLFRGNAGRKPSLLRLMVVAGLAVLVVPSVLVALPWPGMRRAPAVVEYSPLTPVRAVSPGFVRELAVRSDQRVEEGQVVAVLSNDELQMEAKQLEVAIEQSRLHCRVFKEAQQMAAYQAERKNLESLLTKEREKTLQLAHLVIRAPVAGKIICRKLEDTLGTYLAEGTELLSIGAENQKELRLAISQQDIDAFKASLGAEAYVRLPHMPHFYAKLVRVDPRASPKVPHAALCAALDGPLAVREGDEFGDSNEPTERFELLSPRFSGIVQISPDWSLRLRAGQTGFAAVGTGREPIGLHLYNLVSRWVRRQVRQ
jgi:putative peptide zinc metalloprotease protein